MVDLKVLKKISLFHGLDDDHLNKILELSHRKKYKKNGFIFHADDKNIGFFIILIGKVKVTSFSDEGKEIILSILKKDDFYGEMNLIVDLENIFNAISMESTELLFLDRTRFQKLLRDTPAIMENLLCILAKRLYQISRQLSSLALLDVYGRVARFLMDLAMEEGIKTERSEIIINRPTHQEIAARIGATRESVTRTLKDIESRGMIRIFGKKIVVQQSFKDTIQKL